MPLLFLNERSCGTGCDPERADRAMTELARAVLAVVRADRTGTVLVSREPITGLQIAAGHPIGKWHGNPRNRDAWRRLLQMQSKWPHRIVFPEGQDFYDIEYRHQGETVEGLGAAHLMDGLGVSLPVEPCWGADHVALEREQLVEGEDGTSRSDTSEVRVRHLSSPVHYEVHGPWIRDGVEAARKGGLAAVRHGGHLWERRADLFPRLQFLPEMEAHLRALPSVWVQPVRDRLAELEEAVSAWDPDTRPIAPQWRSDVRTEFESRRRLCWFTDLDGEQRLFDWHCEFLPSPGRMHFRLLHDQRTLRIAYVGRKLGV
ncbi:hypothetical protein M1P56_25195 [Streptomyces sp. HU2014]|uniref:hypothetical protein n=1 Tax=Streptomyces sp. HU2014 TaxID=2939414 RepID=UPI00200E058F|nr:hypothetical protein [Streptomyces sp. HU2014]UQI47404.1 hypothetical protein M1P56_25195 [Streptomyces sp. HU2014]